MKQPLLSVQNLSLSTAQHPLLHRVSFEIAKGEIFALVGESGSGKSLTSLAILRLLPEAIHLDGGRVSFKGESLFGLSERAMQSLRGRQIAMIFQEPMSALNPVMRIGEQVAEVLRLHLNLPSTQLKARVIALLEEVALDSPYERYRWYPHQLSGGQKQRLLIAIALACEPTLLIADEPTTALDVTIQAQILTLLQTIQSRRKLSILFITHDLGVVAQIADRVAVMREGRVVEITTKEAFFSQPQHPYTQQLLSDATPPAPLPQTTQTPSPLLELTDLRVSFAIKKGLLQRTVGYLHAVDGVSLSIPKGKTLALVGESGSGKSTLGRAILSLVPLSAGRLWFAGEDITHLTPTQRHSYRRKIQVIFQDPFSALNPRMTIGESILEGMISLDVAPTKPHAQQAQIASLLRLVELDPSHAHRYPHEFSGGQRQRIGIARALALDPELIICDEPTSALDVTVRTQILTLLKRLQADRGLSYLFITHDLSIIDSIAHDVAVMQHGKIVEHGSVTTLMHHPKHPYTQSLLASVPRRG